MKILLGAAALAAAILFAGPFGAGHDADRVVGRPLGETYRGFAAALSPGATTSIPVPASDSFDGRPGTLRARLEQQTDALELTITQDEQTVARLDLRFEALGADRTRVTDNIDVEASRFPLPADRPRPSDWMAEATADSHTQMLLDRVAKALQAGERAKPLEWETLLGVGDARRSMNSSD